MMKIAVCDDDTAMAAYLEGLLEQYAQTHGTALRTECFHSALALMDRLRETDFDLLLLDILMPGLTGIQAARDIRAFDRETSIVFLTASPEFAVESYAVEAFSYLLKPIRKEALFPVLEKLERQKSRREETLLLPTPSGLLRLAYSDIEILEVNSKRLLFYLADGSVQQISGTLAEFEPQLLKSSAFFKVHRSYVVNLDCVRNLGAGELTTYSGKTVPVSRLLAPAVRKAYLDFLFGKEGLEE